MMEFLAIDLASLARVSGGSSDSVQPTSLAEQQPQEPEPLERKRCKLYPDTGKLVCDPPTGPLKPVKRPKK